MTELTETIDQAGDGLRVVTMLTTLIYKRGKKWKHYINHFSKYR